MSHVQQRLGSLIVIAATLFVSYEAQGKDHRSGILNYVACDNKDYAQPISEKSVSGLKWQIASMSGNQFQHKPGPGNTGAAHTSDRMRYLTWDGTCWEAKWDPRRKQFSHKRVTTGQEHFAGYVNYISWDRSKWSSVPDAGQFQHFFIGDADFKPPAEIVKEYVDAAGKVISVVIKILAIL